MPKFSPQTIASLADQKAGLLTGQALANVGERVSQIPKNIDTMRKERASNEALTQGMLGYANKDATMMQQSAQSLANAGKSAEALSMMKAANAMQQTKLQTQMREKLRSEVIRRASAFPELSGLVQTAQNASADQLEAMRKTILAAEQEKQKNQDTRNKAISSAKAVNIDENTIEQLQGDPEGLLAIANAVQQKKQLAVVDKQADDAQIKRQVQQATAAGLPEDDIEAVKNGLYVGENSNFLNLMTGKDSSQQSYMDQKTGQLSTLPARGGKVLVGNKWVYPNDAGLVEGPKVTAETTIPQYKTPSKDIPFVTNASGVAKKFIEGLSTWPNMQMQIATAAAQTPSPIKFEFPAKLAEFQNIVPEALVRVQTGAAIKDDELPRYEKSFGITINDFMTPIAAAEKIIRTSVLLSATSKIMSGEVNVQQGRSLIDEAAQISLSEEDVRMIQSKDPNGFKNVIKKYTDPLLKDSNGSTSNQALSILEELGF
jgi:hypothetical protein